MNTISPWYSQAKDTFYTNASITLMPLTNAPPNKFLKHTITLLDGGVGQELYHRSRKPAHPLWSAKVMMEQPDLVVEVHQDFIKAGANIITLNNYALTPERLARDGQSEWFSKLHQQAIRLAETARDQASSPETVALAGCLPPLVGSYVINVPLNDKRCLSDYQRIVEVQQQAVDLWICETMSSIREARFAVMAAKETHLPIILSLSLLDHSPSDQIESIPKLRSGERLSDAVAEFQAFDLAGITVNCSAPETVSASLPILATGKHPFGGYANGFVSIEPLKPGGTVEALTRRKDLNPNQYADYALSWVQAGATIIGGCCEVSPAHISVIHQRLKMEGYTCRFEC